MAVSAVLFLQASMSPLNCRFIFTKTFTPRFNLSRTMTLVLNQVNPIFFYFYFENNAMCTIVQIIS